MRQGGRVCGGRRGGGLHAYVWLYLLVRRSCRNAASLGPRPGGGKLRRTHADENSSSKSMLRLCGGGGGGRGGGGHDGSMMCTHVCACVLVGGEGGAILMN